MKMRQITCPACGTGVTVSEDQAGVQINCRNCHHVFTVTLPAADAGDALELVFAHDAAMEKAELDHYLTLAPMGITPNSTMMAVQRVYAEDGQGDAYEKLSRVQSRLAVDLLMYPLWQEGKPDHGSE